MVRPTPSDKCVTTLARVEGLSFNQDVRIDVWYPTVQAEARVALVRPGDAEAANCHTFRPTLIGLCDVTVELLNEHGVDILLNESRHGVRVFFS